MGPCGSDTATDESTVDPGGRSRRRRPGTGHFGLCLRDGGDGDLGVGRGPAAGGGDGGVRRRHRPDHVGDPDPPRLAPRAAVAVPARQPDWHPARHAAAAAARSQPLQAGARPDAGAVLLGDAGHVEAAEDHPRRQGGRRRRRPARRPDGAAQRLQRPGPGAVGDAARLHQGRAPRRAPELQPGGAGRHLRLVRVDRPGARRAPAADGRGRRLADPAVALRLEDLRRHEPDGVPQRGAVAAGAGRRHHADRGAPGDVPEPSSPSPDR